MRRRAVAPNLQYLGCLQDSMHRPSRPTQLLYVEDDDDQRGLVSGRFIEAGFVVTAVSSAEVALESLALGHFDVVLTDYNLDGETGAWLLRNASSRGYLEGTTALVLTSEAQPTGVEGYQLLRKPTDLTLLVATVAAAALRPPNARVWS
jgi:CheY-like chemotaxis protein